MNLLIYNELTPKRNNAQFERVCKMLESGNFQQAEVKKLVPTVYFRAKLTDSDRLVFKFVRYKEEIFILLLEIIYNHEYEKSRFLNGAEIDENKIKPLSRPQEIAEKDITPLVYCNPQRKTFHLLDRPLSFDDLQESLFHAKLPLIIVGSAGSGKTVLSLEKMKSLSGNILYVTRSAFLADNAKRLYTSFGYDNPKQSIDFLAFEDLTGSIRSPEGREAEFSDFCAWFRTQPHRADYDATQLYEEFYGVITGHSVTAAYLSCEEYTGLGIKQSIFASAERNRVYEMFLSWLSFMEKNNLYLDTMRCFELLKEVPPRYDWLLIDEVQDLTNVQLYLALRCLKNPFSFLLCGDSNQIVHPNFFSWSSVKSLFFKEQIANSSAEIQILHANYRNSVSVTETANQILRLKVCRFGSVDRESNFLVDCTSETQGKIRLLPDGKNIRQELNDKTSGSVHFAVLVLREADKAAARQIFKTPLVFSVRESKGLEYKNVIIFNLVSSNRENFNVITEGVDAAELAGDLKYSRNKDKSDKSLEIYKFFINSMYVAVTRAVENIYWVEQDCRHPVFRMLKINQIQGKLDIAATASTTDEWRREAVKLAAQGKKEQSASILTDVLKQEPVPWEVLTRKSFADLVKKALDPAKVNNGARQKLTDYAVAYNYDYFRTRLVFCGYRQAADSRLSEAHYSSTYQVPFNLYNRKNLKKKLDRYGADFRDELNRTPLMNACILGDAGLIAELLEQSADPSLTDNRGFSAFHYLLHQIQESGWKSGYAGLFPKLAPPSVTLRLNGKEMKIGSHKAEFLMFHFFWSETQICLYVRNGNFRAFSAPLLSSFFEKMPDFLIPEYRKARTYCSAILSKNEVHSTNPYGMKLFYRLRNGHYMLNPELEMPYEGKWLFWDELAGVRYWEYPLHGMMNTALRFLLHDVRTQHKNASLDRSFIQSRMLQCGINLKYFSEDKESDINVFLEDLQQYADIVEKNITEFAPFPQEAELAKALSKLPGFPPPFFYPGDKLKERIEKNYRYDQEQTLQEERRKERERRNAREEEERNSHYPENLDF